MKRRAGVSYGYVLEEYVMLCDSGVKPAKKGARSQLYTSSLCCWSFDLRCKVSF